MELLQKLTSLEITLIVLTVGLVIYLYTKECYIAAIERSNAIIVNSNHQLYSMYMNLNANHQFLCDKILKQEAELKSKG